MKLKYEKPIAQIEAFETEDVITVSGTTSDIVDPGEGVSTIVTQSWNSKWN